MHNLHLLIKKNAMKIFHHDIDLNNSPSRDTILVAIILSLEIIKITLQIIHFP